MAAVRNDHKLGDLEQQKLTDSVVEGRGSTSASPGETKALPPEALGEIIPRTFRLLAAAGIPLPVNTSPQSLPLSAHHLLLCCVSVDAPPS